MKKILIYAIIALCLVVVGLSYTLRKTRAERDRYKANQTALLADVEHYKTESGLNAASVQKLTLTNKELRQNYADLCQTAKDLDIKIKRLQSVSNAATETKVEIITEVRDSIIYIEDDLVEAITFDWQDPWTDVTGLIYNDSITLNVQSTDTLVQFVHRVPHKFWFIKWGTKAIRQEIVSKNPHTNIVYTKYIELK